MTTVFVIIPVFNRREVTLACIAQLRAQTLPPHKIIVADGGSSDGTPEAIERYFPDSEITVLRAPRELFWGGSMAQGIEYVLGQNPADDDLVMMMNDDTHFPDDYIEMLSRVCMRERAAVGAVVVDAEDNRVLDAGVYIDWSSYTFPVVRELPAGAGFRDDVHVLPGRGTMLTVGMVRAAGNIDAKAFPHYLADYDFFVRLRKSGTRLGVTGETWITADNQSTGLSTSTSPRGLRAALKLAFSRRSKDNLFDHLRFVFRHAPSARLKISLAIRLAFYRLGPLLPPPPAALAA